MNTQPDSRDGSAGRENSPTDETGFVQHASAPDESLSIFMSSPRLIVRQPGRQSAEAFSLKQGENTIGRAEGNSIILHETPAEGEAHWVSRHHATLTVAEDATVTLKDNGSLNGVFVNGNRLVKNASAVISPSDRIGFGGADHFRAQYTMPAPMAEVQANSRILSQQSVGDDSLSSLLQGAKDLAALEGLNNRLELLQRQARATELFQSSTGSQDREQIFSSLSQSLLEVIPGAERCSIFVRNDRNIWSDATTSYAADVDQSRPVEVSRAVVERIEETGNAILSSHALEDLGASESLANQRVRSLLCSPFRHNGEIVGVIQLDSERPGSAFTEEDLKILAQASHLTELANSSAEARQEAEQEKAMLKRIGEEQALSMPEPSITREHFEAVFLHKPLKDAAGDFYDVVERADGKTALVIADVSGHDAAAAFWGAEMKGHLKASLSKVGENFSIADATTEASDQMNTSHRGGRFATAIVGTIDENYVLETVRAGHDPLFLFDSDTGKVIDLDPDAAKRGECPRFIDTTDDGMNLPMSIMESADVGGDLYSIQRYQLKPGDILLGFTDGFNETMDEAGKEYGKTQLANEFSEAVKGGLAPEQIVKTLHEKVVAYADVVHDDLSAVALKIK